MPQLCYMYALQQYDVAEFSEHLVRPVRLVDALQNHAEQTRHRVALCAPRQTVVPVLQDPVQRADWKFLNCALVGDVEVKKGWKSRSRFKAESWQNFFLSQVQNFQRSGRHIPGFSFQLFHATEMGKVFDLIPHDQGRSSSFGDKRRDCQHGSHLCI